MKTASIRKRSVYLTLWFWFLSAMAAGIIFYPVFSLADDDSVCAEVKIEIAQEMTLERQAFDAHMKINNGLSNITLQDIQITVSFSDEDGNSVLASSNPDNTDALFFIKVDSKENIDAIDGSGTINPSSSADIHWLIIPSSGASNGVEKGTLYYVGATLVYTIGGEENITNVSPDYIYVKPMPELSLDYFLPADVYGDDPFTGDIEPPVPFSFGIRITNTGAGNASNLKIDSAQPKITDNDQGLLIGFVIESSRVDDQPVNNSLLVDFGALEAGASKTARWIMSCTLSGQFVDFDAGFSHSDELGGEITSLMTTPVTHFLVHDVLVDLSDRDSVSDFLAKDGDVYRVYESEGTDTDVTDQSASSALQLDGQYGDQIYYSLSTSPNQNFLFIKLPDPFSGQKPVSEAVRSDGKRVKAENVWLSKTKNQNHTWDYFINLFDINTTGSYTVKFEESASQAHPPVLSFISDRTAVAGQQLSFVVEATDPDGTFPVLSASPLPAGANFTDSGDGAGIFDWTPSEGQEGTYHITFTASDGQLTDEQVAIIRINSANDTDGDGMADDWENQYFGNLDRDGTGDYDGDGISDLDEYLNGTDPSSSNAPSIPQIESPANGSEVTVLIPELTIENSTDPDSDPVSYTFEVYADQNTTNLVYGQSDVTEQTGTTTWSPSVQLDDNTWYYWRVRATDGIGYSAWSYGSFFVNTANDPPSVFNISSPPDDSQVDTLTPVLSVTNSQDADEDEITYSFEVCSDAGMTIQVASAASIAQGAGGITSWTVDTPLNDNTWYFWKAVATDEHGASTGTGVSSFFVNLANDAPAAPVISSPASGSQVADTELDLTVTNAGDPDGDMLTYLFELDTVNTFDSSSEQTSGEITEQADSTSWHVSGLSDNTTWFWRVRATDGFAAGPWATGSFFVNTANDAPSAPTLKNPGQGTWVSTLNPTLEVNPPDDPDNDPLVYQFEVYSDEQLTDSVAQGDAQESWWIVDQTLSDNTFYYWRARAEDDHGAQSGWMAAASFFTDKNGVDDPPQLTGLSPSADSFINADTFTINWNDTDPDSNASIALYYDTDNSGEDGTLIASDIHEDPDGADDSYTWDISALEGTYYIYAVISDDTSSQTAYSTGSVTIDRTAPVVSASPAGGTYAEAQTVILSADEPAHVYYTLDGTDPDTGSTEYSSPLNITETTSLKFMAVDNAGNASGITTEIYTLQEPEYLTVTVKNDEDVPFSGVKVYAFTGSGSYTGKSGTTDENGQVTFDPANFNEGTYKFRVDYLGQHFWSDTFNIPGDYYVAVSIEEETTLVNVAATSGPAAGVKVYLFTPSGSYLGIHKTTDESGQVSLDLPVGRDFKFRADIMGNHYWSDVTTITGGEINNIPLETGGGLFRITVQESSQAPMEGIKVYLFSETGSYLGKYAVTDSSGQVSFDVSEGNFKVRADYLGYKFWSDTTTVSSDTDINLDIPHQDVTITVNGLFQGVSDPIEGIKVYLFSPSGSYLGQNRITDEFGQVVFNLPEVAFKARADFSGYKFWSDEFNNADVSLNIPMADADLTVTGGGQPISGIKVYLFSPSGSYLGKYQTTDDQGKVLFRIPAKDYKFRADYQGSHYWSDVTSFTADQVNPVEISTGGGAFDFTLLKGENQPMTGVKCYVFSESGSYIGLSGTTDDNGQVSFNLSDGNYKFRIDYLGNKFWTDIYQLPSTMSDVFTIDHRNDTITVNGMFQGTGDPVEGIKVYLFTPSGSYVGKNMVTDGSGQVIFNLPEVSFKVRADFSGYKFWSDEFNNADVSLNIPMADADLTVTGGGQPISGVKVYLFSPSGSYLGKYQTTDDQGKVLFRIPAKDYKFRADYQGSHYWSDVTSFTADQVNPVEISTGGGAFDFTLLKGENQPMTGVKCYVFSESGSYIGLSGTTDDNGQVSFNLSDGNYKFRIDYLGNKFWTDIYQLPSTMSDVFTIDHRDDTITVNGMFQGTGDPVEGIKVYLFSPSGSYVGKNMVTDGSGQVVFNLPEVSFKVRADFSGYKFWSDEFNNADVSLNIPMADADLTVTGGGQPISGVKVYLFSPSGSYLGKYQTTDDQGKVLFRIPAKDYKFRADYQGSHYWSDVTSFTADQVNPVEISTGGGAFDFTLLKGENQPMTGVKCYVFSESGSYIGLSGTTDDNGQVSFNLSDGNYKFRIDYLGNKFWTDIYEVPSTMSDVFTIPHQDVTITIEGLYQDSSPIEGVKMYLFSSSGSYVGRYEITDAAGQVVFDLPDRPYKIRADYLGEKYWSDEFTSQDTTIIINQGVADIHVERSGISVQGAKVYLFSETGSYLGMYKTTDDSGNTEFLIPARPLKFRADEGGDRGWSSVIEIQAGQVSNIDISLD